MKKNFKKLGLTALLSLNIASCNNTFESKVETKTYCFNKAGSQVIYSENRNFNLLGKNYTANLIEFSIRDNLIFLIDSVSKDSFLEYTQQDILKFPNFMTLSNYVSFKFNRLDPNKKPISDKNLVSVDFLKETKKKLMGLNYSPQTLKLSSKLSGVYLDAREEIFFRNLYNDNKFIDNDCKFSSQLKFKD